jgi:hypothetical protein
VNRADLGLELVEEGPHRRRHVHDEDDVDVLDAVHGTGAVAGGVGQGVELDAAALAGVGVAVSGVRVAVPVAALIVALARRVVAEGDRGGLALLAAAVDAAGVVATTAEQHARARQRAQNRASKVHAARIARLAASVEAPEHGVASWAQLCRSAATPREGSPLDGVDAHPAVRSCRQKFTAFGCASVVFCHVRNISTGLWT